MLDNLLYSITVDNQDIIVRFNRDMIDLDTLSKFLDYLELETIRKRSNLTVEEATTLAEQIDHDMWSKIKQKFIRNLH
jgi:hypothetical protein